jgi:hypothetical protein
MRQPARCMAVVCLAQDVVRQPARCMAVVCPAQD